MRLSQRYYFHVLCNARTVEDETGTVLSDTESARIHATVIAAELAYKGDKYRDCEVCAVDDDGNEIARRSVILGRAFRRRRQGALPSSAVRSA
ncbi:hypothetical protein [Bradyrhizobium sp. Ec3.3]|uniref:DUF6894 family protein n=1 Tax=Bradyrhizobium sp. Ec3.3 TaxID=189753 RepID=UPI003528675B